MISSLIGSILLLAAVCHGAPHGSLSGRIVGGEDATQAQFPHQISLRNGDSHTCGGSIISRNWVLTAAHCVSYDDANGELVIQPASRYGIRAGSNDRFTGGVQVQVVEIIVHEDYGNFLNDVALLRVETPFIYSANIQPIALPTKNTPDDADIIVSGWGRLTQGGDLPRYLQWTTLKSLSLAECESRIQYGYPNILCLLHEADNGVCNGDSGGPALYDNEVVGIAGFVYGGCGTTNPDGYARVYPFVDWIKAHTDVE
ncbi:serine protease SP24D-like [Drosophila montana]|uniref:serine protease SP24D-like n=1 Tax=Drosophila montana TaxID=40370 RepID=UPI00313AE32E